MIEFGDISPNQEKSYKFQLRNMDEKYFVKILTIEKGLI